MIITIIIIFAIKKLDFASTIIRPRAIFRANKRTCETNSCRALDFSCSLRESSDFSASSFLMRLSKASASAFASFPSSAAASDALFEITNPEDDEEEEYGEEEEHGDGGVPWRRNAVEAECGGGGIRHRISLDGLEPLPPSPRYSPQLTGFQETFEVG